MERGAKVPADCIPCPGGYHCPELGTVTPPTCGAGNFSGLHATPCPNGTYGEQRGLSSVDECLPCPAGKYCYRDGIQPPGIPHPTGDCPPGYNCPLGTGFPFSFPCRPGFFWDNSSIEGEDACRPCLPGYYCDSPAMSEPKTCPAGFYCVEGSSKPEPCPEGTYSNKKGLSGPSECSPCGRGFYCAAPGQTGPGGPCKAGFYCQGRALTPLPTDGVTGDVCPAGAYCPPGCPLPIPCPPGTYSNVSGLRSLQECLDCPPGLYCDGTNNQAPSGPCEPGYFCTGGAKSALQQVVMEGHYSLTGAFKPEPCPLGSFQPEQVSQTLMESQTRALVARAHLDTSAQLAQVSHSRALWALTQTDLREKGGPCPVSHFCPEGTSFPLPCLAGTYNNLTRQAACFPCAAGYYCPENTTSYSMNPCPAGFYCPKGTRFATEFPCPRGYYNPDAMTQSLDSCLPCPPGHFCGKENLTAASGECDAGLSVPSGECSAGFYCKGGAALPKPTDGVTGNICPVGTYCSHYCPRNTQFATQYPCPPGTYSEALNIWDASKCQLCPPGRTICVLWVTIAPLAAQSPYRVPLENIRTRLVKASVKHAQQERLSSPSGPCLPGYYCTSKARIPNPVDDETGSLCPAGRYCPPGSSKPELCPAGTFLPQSGMVYRNACLPCPGGKFCQGEGLASVSGGIFQPWSAW
ncbi:zonadhesin-like isoform x4 [Limosa lapponica baueri]|uniref:Zonadhesin-like isoform x4 n=1 Tax=Limosa lapponica baueri TaxID=1758121 RepID=A0A2I0THA0_LIMLA|nr:zonadhesin-like isoform x4 [Limosa lapponica baueri]